MLAASALSGRVGDSMVGCGAFKVNVNDYGFNAINSCNSIIHRIDTGKRPERAAYVSPWQRPGYKKNKKQSAQYGQYGQKNGTASSDAFKSKGCAVGVCMHGLREWLYCRWCIQGE